MMELLLSSDGEHTVHVVEQTSEDLIQLLPQATLVYEAVVRAYGGKGQTQRPGNGEGEASVTGQGNGNGTTAVEAPLCPVLKTLMAYREGRYGAFWSCPTREADVGGTTARSL